MTPNSSVCQIRAVTAFAAAHSHEPTLQEIPGALQAAREVVEDEMAWRKIHGREAA
jgi:hypothetical protein